MDRAIQDAVAAFDSAHVTPEVVSLLLQMQAAGVLEPQDSGAGNRGPWTEIEDTLLTNAVRTFGSKRWTEIAKSVPNRNAKQCRERWCNRLEPGVKHDPFEPWEDQLIITKQKEIGNRWALIAKQLNGRSTNAVKNRWYAGLKQAREQGGDKGKGFGEGMYQEIMSGVDLTRNEYGDL
jgi:hypothetical protein